MHRTPPAKPLVPTACPSCRSAELKATTKTVDDRTYWRCLACGEIWNAGRRREAVGWGLGR